MKIDLHIHSEISSCGHQSLDEIIAAAGTQGIDGVCITDHDTMAALNEVDEGLQSNGIYLFVGMEYTTTEGDFLIFGEFENIPLNMLARELVTYVVQRGGALIAAHPFRKKRAVAEYLILDAHVKIVESVNGRNSDFENRFFQFWAQHRDLTFSGGSDAHTSDEIGKVVTEFSNPITSRKELIKELKAGNCQPLYFKDGAYYEIGYISGNWSWRPR